MTDSTDRKLWWVSFLVLMSAIMTLLGVMRGCSLAPKQAVFVEKPLAGEKCDEASDGEVRSTPCSDPQDGKIFKVCRDGDWSPVTDTCRNPAGSDDSDDGSSDGTGPVGCGPIFADVRPILTDNCLGCHFTPSRYDDYMVVKDRIDDFLGLINLPPDNVRRMPRDPKDPLSWDDVQALEDWRDNGRRLDCDSSTPDGGLEGTIELEDIEKVILEDQANLEEDDRKNTRYLVTSHKHNLGDSDENLFIFESAINKLLNHLNFQKETISKAQQISPTVFRFDLRSFSLDRRDWGVIEDNDEVDLESFTDRGKTIKFLSGARKAWLHFDNFIEITGKANVYYNILGLSRHLHDYLGYVGVDIHQQLADLDPFFVGGNGSEISLNKNRLIVRFEGNDDFPFTWITFDPIDLAGVDRRNLFFAPLLSGTGGTGTRNFEFAASETITQTKTGFIAALWGADGARQDSAPLDIVTDTRSPLDPTINNPIDCFRCHQGGYIPMSDQIRDHVSLNASQFDAEDVDIMLQVYRPQGSNVALFQSDNSYYKRIADKVGFDLNKDPITYAHDRYKLDWDIREVAAFLFFSKDSFTSKLSRSSSGRTEVGQLLSGGTITFNQLIQILPDLKRELRLFQEDL